MKRETLHLLLALLFAAVVLGACLLHFGPEEVFSSQHLSNFFAKLAGFGLAGWGNRKC
jgi:hypothetical protein